MPVSRNCCASTETAWYAQGRQATRAEVLASIESGLPALRAVAFNGGASAKLGLKILAGRRDLALIPLPSSSPAHTLRFARKLEAWGPLAAYLD